MRGFVYGVVIPEFSDRFASQLEVDVIIRFIGEDAYHRAIALSRVRTAQGEIHHVSVEREDFSDSDDPAISVLIETLIEFLQCGDIWPASGNRLVGQG
ncbi:MAG: hypothetical protein CMJ34_01875 [Phycisphaerae bacterium]|nr:hypothetical protein [Phycisphaerae bacterium]